MTFANANLKYLLQRGRIGGPNSSLFIPPLAVAAGAIIAGGVSIANEVLEDEQTYNEDRIATSSSTGVSKRRIELPSPSFHRVTNTPQVMATSAVNKSSPLTSVAPKDKQPIMAAINSHKGETKVTEYDFVVIGNGNAGQSAVSALRRLCPYSSVAIIDPNLSVGSSIRDNKMTHYMQQAATGLDHGKRIVQLSDGSSIHFRQSILLATGARGSPPPPSLVDDRAMSRILELRSTEAFASSSSIESTKQRRPVMSPEGVRQMTLMAASQGAKVCVMGSGVEALDLAAAAAAAHSSSTTTSSSNIMNGGKRRTRKGKSTNGNIEQRGEDAKVTLIFGGAGVLSTRLPRYLSVAVAKRLQQRGIEVQSRSLVRYVAMHNNKDTEECEIHTAKSYDTMDTQRTRADLIILAPSIKGQCGTAVIPIAAESSSVKLPSSFTPWSFISPLINCYVDDGRIVVNSELNAASRIYAAGSVAKHPSPETGHASVSGEGLTDATLAGEVAAHNMAREYYERSSARPFGGRDFGSTEMLQSSRSFSLESCPVWRTDIGAFGSFEGHLSSLSSLGINALCVGNCDSETMATHGFFWTNQTTDNRRRNTLDRKMTRSQANEGSLSLPRRRSTRRSSTLRRSVYGSGIVFYFDRSGAIRGVMTWGLPFATLTKDGSSVLNAKLVDRIRDIINTNGEVTKACHRDAVMKRDARLDSSMLSSYHLSEETKVLASIALSSSSESAIEMASQPLHRYVPSKPARITGIGMLKRRDEIGTGGVGEDLFARIPTGGYSENVRPQSLVHVYPMNWGSGSDLGSYVTSTTGAVSSNPQDELKSSEENILQPPAMNYEATRRAMKVNDVRSRPPKEEPLWMREGDASKATSMNDVLTDVFLTQVRRGRFQDGSDSVKQAPTPKIIEGAKSMLKEWTSSGNTDREEGDAEDFTVEEEMSGAEEEVK